MTQVSDTFRLPPCSNPPNKQNNNFTKSVNNKRSNPESRLTEVSENVLARSAPTKNVPLKKIKTEVIVYHL